MLEIKQTMPPGVIRLYVIQALSVFGFAALYSSLELYLTKQLGLSDTLSNGIVGLFVAFNYWLHLVGGVIGGRYLSNRVLFFLSTVFEIVGLLLLASLNGNYLYFGLIFYLIGSGLGVTVFNNLLTQQFDTNDHRRDTAFMNSYSMMYLGYFIGFFCSGFFDHSSQYQGLFIMAILTNITSLILLMNSWSLLKDKDTSLQEQVETRSKYKQYLKGCSIILLLIPILFFCFKNAFVSNSLVVAATALVLLFIGIAGMRQKSKSDRKKIMVFLILAIISTIFWTIYYTEPMGLTLFIKNNADKNFMGYIVPTQWILNINTIVIILFAPIFAVIFRKLRLKGYKIFTTSQFLWAFIFLSASFFSLGIGISFTSSLGYSSLFWTFLFNVFEGFAEIMIGPVGYAMIGRIAPAKWEGFLMGAWMMISGASASLSLYFSNAMVKSESVNPLVTNYDYQRVFNQMGVLALVGGLLLYGISRKIRTVIDSSVMESD